MANHPIISIKDLTYTYAATETPALRNINLTINEGEYVSLLGLNGSGKTSLLLCLNGIIPNMMMGEFEGSVVVDGFDTTEVPVRELAKLVGMVFDNPEFQISQWSIAEEIALGLENLGISPNEMVKRIRDMLEVVGLPRFEERSPWALSGGQQQRVSIASALAMYPKILVMDEPTSNLDPIGKEEVFQVANNLNLEKKMTIVVAEHEVEVMAAYADRIILMDNGEIILNGTPEEVFSQVDRFEKIGLRVPQVTAVTKNLEEAKKIKALKKYPVTVDQFYSLVNGLI